MPITQEYLTGGNANAIDEILKNVDLLYMCGHFEEALQIVSLLLTDKGWQSEPKDDGFDYIVKLNLLLHWALGRRCDAFADVPMHSQQMLDTWSVRKAKKELLALMRSGPLQSLQDESFIERLIAGKLSMIEEMNLMVVAQTSDADTELLLALFNLKSGNQPEAAAEYFESLIKRRDYMPPRNANLFSLKRFKDFYSTGILSKRLELDKTSAQLYVEAVRTRTPRTIKQFEAETPKHVSIMKTTMSSEKVVFTEEDERAMAVITEKLEKVRRIRHEKMAGILIPEKNIDPKSGYILPPKPSAKMTRYQDSYNPGLSRDAITELTARLPFRLPRELYALYEWRNGIPEEEDDRHLVRDQQFYSLEEALRLYDQAYEMQSEYGFWDDVKEFSGVDLTLCFPIGGFEDPELFVPSEKHPSIKGHKRPVIMNGEGGTDVWFYTFEQMLDTVAEWFENKELKSINGYPAYMLNPVLERKIWQKHNPGIWSNI